MKRTTISTTASMCLLALLLAGCWSGVAQDSGDATPGAAADGALAIRSVTLIDGTGAPPRAGTTVVIRDGRIAGVGPDDEVRVPTDARTIDGRGRYLMPGLWDLHVHLAKAGGHVLPLFLANGVTGVRDMGGDARVVAGIRDEVAKGIRKGPRILMAGPIVESGGYMASARDRDLVEPVERFRVGVDTPERARRVVDSIAGLGADFVKFRTTDSLPVYHAIADAARAAGLDVVGHAQNLPAEDVLRAGQRSVEHALFPFLTQRDSKQAERLAGRFAAAGTAFVPTLVTFERSIFADPVALEAMLSDTAGRAEPRRAYLAGFLIDDWEEQLDERLADAAAGDTLPWRQLHSALLMDLRLLHAAGAPVLPGTDVAVLNIFPGSSLHDELELLVELVGLSPMEAIEAATRRAAALVGLADETGTVESGKAADVVLLSADPVADIRNTRRIDAVIKAGVVYGEAGLRSLRDAVRAEAAAVRTEAATHVRRAADAAPAIARNMPNPARPAAPATRAMDSVPTGSYALQAVVGDRAFPVRLDLLAIDGRPWGRLTISAGDEQVVAVDGIERSGDAWRFVVGGRCGKWRSASRTPLRELGGSPPIPLSGRRAGPVTEAEELRAQHLLAPVSTGSGPGGRGDSFPTGTSTGALIFASHGPDLSRQTLVIVSGDLDGRGEPRALELSGRHSDRSPMIDPRTGALIFASDRPGRPDRSAEGYRLWFATPDGSAGWEERRPVEFEGGWPHDARQPSITTDGTLYFSSDAPNGEGEGDIYEAARVAERRWARPRNLGRPVNGPGDEHGAFVAPDGMFMILSSAAARRERSGGDDLYISHRTPDGWTTPRALELPVNTFANE